MALALRVMQNDYAGGGALGMMGSDYVENGVAAGNGMQGMMQNAYAENGADFRNDTEYVCWGQH